jgi:hypothetical protein
MTPLQDAATLLLSAVFSVTLVLLSARILARAGKSYRDSETVVRAIITTYGQRLTRQEELSQAMSNEVKDLGSSLVRLENSLGDSTGRGAQDLEHLADLIPAVKEVSLNIRSLNETLQFHTGEITEVAPGSRMKSTIFAADFPANRNDITTIELQTLKILAAEGPKTSRELQPRIGRSREHFARLMKRLYERGYVDRDVTRIPFVYSINQNISDKVVQKRDLSTL